MKNILTGVVLSLTLILATALVSYNSGFNVIGGFGGEPAYQADNSSQTADWIYCKSNGTAVFEVPASGILAARYGGTGKSTPTSTVTNLVINGNGYLVVATNANIPAPIVGSMILCTSNYSLILVSPTKTNVVSIGQ